MQWAKKQTGFTIVELLIVVVVIAILAAITIVSYNGIQNRANDTVVKGDLSNIAKKIESYKIENGTYPVPVPPDDSTAVLASAVNGFKATQSGYILSPLTSENNTVNLIYCTDPAGSLYRLAAWSKTSRNQGFMIGSNLGLQDFNQAINGSSTLCPALGIPSSPQHLWLYDLNRAGGWRPFVR